jgi:hypothetical protein
VVSVEWENGSPSACPLQFWRARLARLQNIDLKAAAGAGLSSAVFALWGSNGLKHPFAVGAS